MRASEVRILPALEPGESYVEPAFVLVETTVDSRGEAVTTIEHLATELVDGTLRWHIATLGQSVPLSHAGALEWAVSFAASRGIPVVYHRDDSSGGSYAAALNSPAEPVSSSASK